MSQTATSHVTTLGGLKARYLRWDNGNDHDTRPAVLMLHGLRSYAGTWAPFANQLSTDHQIIAPDFRGRGDSEWDPARNYFLSTYLTDIEELAAELALPRFAIVGHSMGGAVGYAYAAAHPEQVTSLIVEDIGPGSSTTAPGAERVLREMRSVPPGFDSIDAARHYWRGIRPGIPDAALQSRLDETVLPTEDGRWQWKLDMTGIAQARLSGDPAGQVDLWKCVEALRCPTLVLRGEQTDFLPVAVCQQMAARQPLLRWAEIPGAGHYVHDDNPGDFLRAIQEFLR
ncbi:MAG: alpha/beta fold hydrolase [Trebonia sp.]